MKSPIIWSKEKGIASYSCHPKISNPNNRTILKASINATYLLLLTSYTLEHLVSIWNLRVYLYTATT